MRKLFLLLYGDVAGTREQVKEAVNSCPYVITWRYDLPHSFYLVSEASAKEIATSLHEKLPKGRFVVVEATEDFWGWGSQDTWYFFRNKKVKPAELNKSAPS